MSNDNKRNDILKGFTTASLLGYLGYKSIDQQNVGSAVKSVEAITKPMGKPEMRGVGETLKTNVDLLKETMEKNRTAAIQSMRERFLNEIESYFPTGDEGIKNPNEARAFFSALFDAVKEEEIITSESQSEIDDALRRMYDLAGDPNSAKVDKALALQDRQTLTSFFKDAFSSNEIALERFGKHYSKYAANIELFAGSSRKSNTFVSVPGQKHVNSLNNINEFFSNSSNKQNENIIRNRFKRLNSKFGSATSSITLKAINEGGAADSLYAQVTLKNNKVLNVPLFLGTDEAGNIIYRATEELGGSSYVAPNNVLRANKMLVGSNLSETPFANLSQARAAKAIVSFNEYIFDEILSLDTGRFAGLSQREINDITAYQRNFGLDSPRTMSSQYRGFMSKNIYSTLKTSRMMQGSNAIVTGLENFSYAEQKVAVKNLLGFFSNELIGANAAQTMTSRYEDPFNKNQTKLFGNIGIRSIGNVESVNPFNAIKIYGRLDRALLPQTAREGQMFGRYESIEGISGSGSGGNLFGVNRRSIVGSAEDGSLLGIKKGSGAGSTVGLNLAGIFVKKETAERSLGLAEGVSYFGGKVTTSTSMPKTVVESGIADTKLMERLIGLSRERSPAAPKGIMVGNVNVENPDLYHKMSIEDFFKQYGNKDGVALLGHLDADFSGIKRRHNMEGFTMSLVEHGSGSGRDKYFLIGQMNNTNMNTKLFSWLVKDTTLELTSSGLTKKLNNINSTLGAKVMDTYFNQLGGNLNNTLLSSTGQLKKSVYNISSGIFGALEMGGIDSKSLTDSMRNLIGGNNQYLKRIETLYGVKYDQLKDASVKHRQGAYLDAVVETVIKNRGSLDDRSLGFILGSIEEHGKKFSYTFEQQGGPGVFQNTLTRLGLTSNVFKEALQSSFVVAAGYGTTGGVHAELGRNLARVEPRFFNYTYTSLRSNFGLSVDEATKYMSSLLIRQKGVESKASSLFGMHLGMMSLSPLNEIDMNRLISSRGNIELLSKEQTKELMSFSQGEEKRLVDFLSQNEKGQLVDLENVISGRDRLEKIKSKLGGRTKIYLPGSETLENFSGFKIRNAGQSVAIENEYNRYLGDLISSISGLGEAETMDDFDKHLRGFDQSKRLLSTVVGSGIRQSLSGEILGSGSYMGSGFKFGLDEASSTLFDDATTNRQGLLRAFEQNKGYALFLDAQAFMDGMTTYEQAVVRKYEAEGMDKEKARSLAKKDTATRLQDFFFGMHKDRMSGPSGLGMRNPNIFITHYLPGINLMRYDFARGNEDAMFKYFREYRGTFLNEAGLNAQKEARRELIQSKRLALFNANRINKLNNDSYNKYIEERKALVEKRESIRTKIGGEIELTPEGNKIEETFEYKDKTTGEVKTGTRLKRTGNVYPFVSMSMKENEDFFERLHSQIKTKRDRAKTAKANVLSNMGAATRDKLNKLNAIQVAFSKGGLEPFDRLKGSSSRIYSRALERKLDSALTSIVNKHGGGEVFENLRNLQLEAKEKIRQLEISKKQLKGSEDLNAIDNTIKRLRKTLDTIDHIVLQKQNAGLVYGLTPSTKSFGNIKASFKKDFSVTGGNFSIDKSSERFDARGKVSARQLFGTGFKINEEGRLVVTELDVNKKVASLQLESAYDNLYGRKPESPVEFLQRAKTVNILRKQLQVEAMQGSVSDLKQNIKDIDLDIAKLKTEAQTPDVEKQIQNLENLKIANQKQLATEVSKLEGKDTDLKIHGSFLTDEAKAELKDSKGLISTLNDLKSSVIESEDGKEVAKHLNVNRRIAIQGISDYRYANQNINMPHLDNFFGMHSAGLKPRIEAEKALNNFLEQNVGKDKKYSSVSRAVLDLMNLESNDNFKSVTYTRSVFDEDTGDFLKTEKVTKTFKTTDRTINRLAELEEEIKNTNIDLFTNQVEEHKRNSLIHQLYGKRDAVDKEIEDFYKKHQVEEEFRQANISENELDFDKRKVQLSTEDMDKIYQELPDEYKVSFDELVDSERKNKLIADKKSFSVLSNLEEHLKFGRIESFEELLSATKGRYNESMMGYYGGEERATTVGQEVDRMFLGLLRHHSKEGYHGGGIVRFPEINITAELFNKSGDTFKYSGRMDVSRFMIGDFDADIYQIYHDTNKILQNKFQQSSKSFHGFYQAGAEYLMHMKLLGEGMVKFGDRLGVSGINLETSLLDEYSKEKIIKDTGPIDVQVKAGMISLIQGASEAAARGEDPAKLYKRIRAGASLVAIAQEVLVIKSKHLAMASTVADDFLTAMRQSFSSGSGEHLSNFFEQNIFRETILSKGEDISVRDVKFTDLPDGVAAREIRSALEQVKLQTGDLREVFDEMSRVAKDRNILSFGSDKRLQDIMNSSDVFSLKQFNQLLSVGLEGGFIGADGSLDYDKFEAGFRNIQKEVQNSFKLSASGRGVGALGLGAVAASYLIGAGSSVESLEPSQKFSDLRAKSAESQMIANKDHSDINHQGLSNMGSKSGFNAPQINIGNSYITQSHSAKMYGEAPSYSSAMGAARSFTSMGGQAFISVQDNRRPISNNYVTRSLRD